MRPSLNLLLPLVLVAPALAQKFDLRVQTAHDQTERFTIQAKIATNETRKTLVNGEEMGAGGGGRGGFGGGGGAGGELTVGQEIVFDQGPAKENWRQYHKVTATEQRSGQNGEGRETKTEGGLQGKKVWLKPGEGGEVTLVDGEGDKAAPVPAALSRGVPGRVVLDGLVPAKAVGVGEEFELDAGLLAALRGLAHPVTVERGQAGRGAGGRGEGAQGGEGGRGQRGQGGQGARGQGGAGGRAGGMFGTGAAGMVIQLLGGGKLTSKATGKLVSVETKDGQEIATIEITAKLSGKGSNEELGLPAAGGFGAFGGGRGGRGGQGGAGAAPTGTSAVDASFDLKGKVLVNVTRHRIAAIELAGDLAIDRQSKNEMERDGETTRFESSSKTKGKVELQVQCESAAK